jgi:hypothetical protein
MSKGSNVVEDSSTVRRNWLRTGSVCKTESEVPPIVDACLVNHGQNGAVPSRLQQDQPRGIRPPAVRKRQPVVCIVVVVQSQPQLLQIIATLRPPSRFSSLLHGRQKESHKDRNNGDHDQQFDKRETSTPMQCLTPHCDLLHSKIRSTAAPEYLGIEPWTDRSKATRVRSKIAQRSPWRGSWRMNS